MASGDARDHMWSRRAVLRGACGAALLAASAASVWDPFAAKADGEPWDPTLPIRSSADVPGDPVAVMNKVTGITQTSAQVTEQLGRSFLSTLGINVGGEGAIPGVYGPQAVQVVLRRGLSQLGQPYSWGGGTAAGPSTGIDSGAHIVGFDCSGLVLYSYAGIGVRLPHYSGAQYNAGLKVPHSGAKPGDCIFYGPGGSQHVTLYLGNGRMLEAPDYGIPVRVAPVRTSGLTPYVTRFINW